MIYEVFGDTGAGKSAYLTAQIEDLYFNHGAEMLKYCRDIIDLENKERSSPLSYPTQPPIYTNFKVNIKKPDGSVFIPYKIEAKEIGINEPGKKEKYKFFPPGSAIFLDEAQNDFNSKDGECKRDVYAFFEKHRHDDLIIWLAAQRGILINKDIRGLCSDFREIIKREHEESIFKTVTKTRWHYRRFTTRYDFEKYLATNGGEGKYKNEIYDHMGNIFESYDCKSCRKEFLPPEGADFVF